MSQRSKPDCNQAMFELIAEIRGQLPFDLPIGQLCRGPCRGCPKKLLEYLDQRLIEWEGHLQAGGQVKLGDLAQLAKTGRKVHRVLAGNGLVDQT